MRVATLLTLALALLGFGADVRVGLAQSGPRIEVRQVGWQPDGTLLAGSWNPVLVRVTGNGDTDSASRVQVVLKTQIGTAARPLLYPQATYGQEVALPAGVAKDLKIWVPVPSDAAYVVSIQVVGQRGQVLAEESAYAQAGRSDIPLVATLADTSTLAAQLGRIDVPYQQGLTAQVRTVELTAADVPAQPEYLSGFRALAVQGNASATLTGEQRRAIQDWVVQGGQLLLIGGPDGARATSVLDGPGTEPRARFGGLDGSADLGPLAEWASPGAGAALGSGSVARIEAPAAERLAGTAERPLAVRAAWGDGTLALLAADSTLDPLRGWGGTPGLLKRALEPALSSPRSNDPSRSSVGGQQRPDDLRLITALDALPPEVFPDWQHVGLLLGGFALVAGPLLHLLLWRADRRPWLWAAVPALSVLVTVGITIFAGAQPGRDVLANAVSEIRLDPRTGEAHQTIAIGFFAPLRDQLSVRASGEVPVRVWAGSLSTLQQSIASGISGATTFGGPLPGVGTDSPYRVITGRDTQIEFVSSLASQGGLRSLVMNRTLPSLGRIETDLRIEGSEGLIKGTIRNATPYSLDQVGLAVGVSLTKVGPLAPGQTAAVSFDPRTPPPSAPGNFAYSLAWQMFGVPSASLRANTQSSTALELPQDTDVRRRVKVMETVLARSDRSRYVYSAGGQPFQQATPVAPMLVAMTNNAIGDHALPSVGSQRTFSLSVVEEPIQFAIAPGPFTLTPVLLPPSVSVDSAASMTQANGGPGALALLDLRGGTATYTFHANLTPAARVDSLVVKTQESTAPAIPPGSSGLVVTRNGPPDPPGPSTQGTFSAFNWGTETWAPLAAGQTQANLSGSEGFVAPDGSVRIQVSSGGANKTVRFLPPELTMQGEVAP
jgi:hypothetical protein